MVHCAGRGIRVRVVEKDGEPGSLETYEEVIKLNLIGSFNVLRIAAARMARAEPIESERGVCVLTASVAAWDGTDRADPLRLGEGRHRRDDAGRRARSGQ